MAVQRKREQSRDGGVSDFFWNIIGGGMVALMIGGAVYLFIGMVGSHIGGQEKYWELVYLKWYVIIAFAVYMIMPTLLANIVGFIFGSKSRASGSKT